MNTQKYKWLFYFIAATIVTTIAVQFYWNYKNYEDNKQHISNEIQISLDNAIEEYYAKLAKEETTTIVNFNDQKFHPNFIDKISFDSVLKRSSRLQKLKSLRKKDKAALKSKFEITSISFTSDDKKDAHETDSLIKDFAKEMSSNTGKIVLNSKNNLHKNHSKIKYFTGKESADSLKLIKNLRSIFISVTSNSIEYKELDSLIKNQLNKKKIAVDFEFNHIKNDSIFYTSKDSLNIKKFSKNVTANSTYLKRNEEFKLLFNTPNIQALKRSSTGILLSFLLSLLIISCLFYLLKIINKQKELAAIKNDLISNITHEFKTPIATVSTAIEAIENFNVIDDKEKIQKYLSMSSLQLKKLHLMVEKLLETATLDSEQLLLKKETIDIVEIVDKLVVKHKLLAKNKELNFSTNLKPIYLNVDVFHFENVISNLIDNAIKYGGNHIEINLNSILKSTEITIADDGKGIEKNQQEKIFDKFYRVPKGNTHDVKGFGIGLYYCKKIIDKHQGNISISSDKNQTVFKINIPNE